MRRGGGGGGGGGMEEREGGEVDKVFVVSIQTGKHEALLGRIEAKRSTNRHNGRPS